MLQSLSIRNVVLIDKLDIDFKPQLSVLTGETGAGKSILLDSLGLVLGKRAETSLIRQGEDKLSVTAIFDAEPDNRPLQELLAENELDAGDEIIIKRVLNRDGKGKIFFNDQPISAKLLKDIGKYLVEIHGQFDNQGLLIHRADICLDGNILILTLGFTVITAHIDNFDIANVQLIGENSGREQSAAADGNDSLRHLFRPDSPRMDPPEMRRYGLVQFVDYLHEHGGNGRFCRHGGKRQGISQRLYGYRRHDFHAGIQRQFQSLLSRYSGKDRQCFEGRGISLLFFIRISCDIRRHIG